MAENVEYTPLPADLPEDWTVGQTVAPAGADVGLPPQYGFNYLNAQLNNTQRAVNQLAAAKQDKLTGTAGQVVGFNAEGEAEARSAVLSFKNRTGAVTPQSGDYSVAQVTGAAPKESPVFTGSISLGRKLNTTVGSNSFAVGVSVEASGSQSHAEGTFTVATKETAHAEGTHSIAAANHSHAEGVAAIAISNGAHAEGINSIAAYASDSSVLKISTYDDATKTFSFDVSDPIFSSAFSELNVGDKLAISNLSYYGWVYICTVISKGTDTATVEGITNSQRYSFLYAVNLSRSTSYSSSHAEGMNTLATRYVSHAEGSETIASGMCSHAEGCNTMASGAHSHAEGYETKASAFAQHVGGKFNVEYTSDATKLIIGSGGSALSRANCFRVTDTGTYGVGAWNSSGADYAELFEWLDSNPNAEDRAGLFVTLEGDRLRLAGPEDDFILGIVSADPSVVGDVYDDQWAGMYLRDVFGRTIMEMQDFPAETTQVPREDGTMETVELIPARRELAPVVNPEYDHTVKYLPRTQRPEWDAVGMMGKLVAVDDGTCQVNGWCAVGEGGKATHSDTRTRCRVMARLDETHIRVLIL